MTPKLLWNGLPYPPLVDLPPPPIIPYPPIVIEFIQPPPVLRPIIQYFEESIPPICKCKTHQEKMVEKHSRKIIQPLPLPCYILKTWAYIKRTFQNTT